MYWKWEMGQELHHHIRTCNHRSIQKEGIIFMKTRTYSCALLMEANFLKLQISWFDFFQFCKIKSWVYKILYHSLSIYTKRLNSNIKCMLPFRALTNRAVYTNFDTCTQILKIQLTERWIISEKHKSVVYTHTIRSCIFNMIK